MSKRVVIIQGHPDPERNGLCHAIADAYAVGAELAGASVQRVELGLLDFPVMRSKQDYHQGKEGTPEVLKPAQDAIIDADHIVIVFPLWLGTMPAQLKAFLEQTLRPGVALEYPKKGYPRRRLSGKSGRVVVTMGMPALAYRWYFRAHGLKNLRRNILGFCGVRPIRETLFGMVEAVSKEKRQQWLDKIRRLALRDVS